MSKSKSTGTSAPVYQTFGGSYGANDYNASKRLSQQAESMIGQQNPFATPLEQALLNPSFTPNTGAEQALISGLMDQTAGRTATRGLGAPTESAYAAAIAPTLVDLRNTQIANLLGAQQGAQSGNASDLQALMELIGYSMPQIMGGNQSTETTKTTGLFCWVAREVYGIENPKWKLFRHWMLTKAPKWFRNLYIKYGIQFAEFLKGKDNTKSIIRWWMDGRINAMFGGA